MDEIVGKKFQSNSCNQFTVIAETDKRAHRMRLFEVIFDEVNGIRYKRLAKKDEIIRGKVKNPFYPSVYGIGYLGNAVKTGNEKEYNRWNNMISRCYNPDDPKYNTYGANGVTVCDRWLCFENYLNDFTKIDGYDKDNLSRLQLDKDIKIKGNKIYSLETCMFVPIQENVKEMNARTIQKEFIAISPNGDIYESNHQRDFAKEHGLAFYGINDVLKEKQKTHKGWKFNYKN